MIRTLGGIVVGTFLGMGIMAACVAAKEADRQAHKPATFIKKKGQELKFGDVLMLMGSEGENLPRLDIRREVAEQLGCDPPDGIMFGE